MNSWNRLPHALHQAVVVSKRSINFSKRCSRQDDVSGGGFGEFDKDAFNKDLKNVLDP